MVRPDGETKRDRRRQWIVGIAAVIGLFSLTGNVVLTYQSIKSNNNHHAASARQNNTIFIKDKEIVKLLNEHSVTFAQQGEQLKQAAAYDTDVYNFALTIEDELRSICSSTHADCPPLPALPAPN